MPHGYDLKQKYVKIGLRYSINDQVLEDLLNEQKLSMLLHWK